MPTTSPSTTAQITELNEAVESAKTQQKRLDSELDLIGSQQGELEEILTGLEKKADLQQPLATTLHADVQRTKMSGRRGGGGVGGWTCIMSDFITRWNFCNFFLNGK